MVFPSLACSSVKNGLCACYGGGGMEEAWEGLHKPRNWHWVSSSLDGASPKRERGLCQLVPKEVASMQVPWQVPPLPPTTCLLLSPILTPPCSTHSPDNLGRGVGSCWLLASSGRPASLPDEVKKPYFVHAKSTSSFCIQTGSALRTRTHTKQLSTSSGRLVGGLQASQNFPGASATPQWDKNPTALRLLWNCQASSPALVPVGPCSSPKVRVGCWEPLNIE